MAETEKESFIRAGERQNPVLLRARRLFWRLISPLPDRPYLQLKFLSIKGEWPDLDHPRTFCEKLQHRKLHDRNPLYIRLVDKLAVKSFIAERIGERHAVPTLWSGTRLADIDWRMIPLPAVLKPNHASGLGTFLHGPADVAAVQRDDPLPRWLAIDHARYNREWAYAGVPRQAMIEPLLTRPDGGVPWDYRCFVFHGRVALIGVDVREANQGYCANFDRQWSRLGFHDPDYYPPYPGSVPPPPRLDEMLRLAETVAEGLDFVRVDFYDTGDRLYIGELTLYPGGGFEAFEPKTFDRWLGDHWRIGTSPAA
ncbi:polysaccharide biosynthesis protein [Microvirga tunisiensis]|uniref:Polysaccharide biosynthesis protein n=2 Tax=Pannonibacter tanglangensis TaxID=2750084 RepID=A0ABW9ZGJ0_9HYPH|nr:polysaccharide biosynthesis protein [Pannonibacter sp. XCT-34]NBN77605.1 polysaccharide biosynthesis protein [Pannonibacter sp. XCT-53]